MKNTVTEINNTMDRFNSKLDTSEEKVNKPKDMTMMIEIVQHTPKRNRRKLERVVNRYGG